MRNRQRCGFTLVELLVVIAIISMLASILMPVTSKARERGRQAVCLSNQRQIGLAILMYAQDNSELLPISASVWAGLNLPKGVVTCPTQRDDAPVGYAYNNAISGMSLGDLPYPVKTVFTIDGSHEATTSPMTYDNVMYSVDDIERRHNGHAICGFADGHTALDTDLSGFWYFRDFEQSVAAEWSDTRRQTTPRGNRQYLGPFGKEAVRLNLTGLPAHNHISITIDLYVLGSWVGSGTPDIWVMSVDNGPELLRTTFDNHNRNLEANPQAFPGAYPTSSNAARTNTAENDTLGFRASYPTEPNEVHDAVYNVKGAFDHQGNAVTLVFSGDQLTAAPLTEKAWGIDNINVVGE